MLGQACRDRGRVEANAVNQWLARRVIAAEPRADPSAGAVANAPERLPP